MQTKPLIYKVDIGHTKTFDWRLLSLFLLGMLILASIATNKEQYISSQLNIFILSNQAMQILPQDFWHNLTYLGDALILIPFLSFICLVNVRAWAGMFGAIPIAIFLSHTAKAFFAIPRPAAILNHDQFTIIGHTLTAHTSFPSGHTVTIFTAITALIFVYLKQIKKRTYFSSFITIMLLVFASLVAISRVAVGAHWPADLIFGAIVGSISGLSGEYLCRHYTAWWQWTKDQPIYLGYFILSFFAALLLLTISGKLPGLAITWIAMSISGAVGAYISLNALLKK